MRETIWQQVVFELHTVETITVEMEIPVEDEDSVEDIVEYGMDLAKSHSSDIWTNPDFEIKTDLVFKQPRIIQWYPDLDGKPDYSRPLTSDSTGQIVQSD